MSLYKAHPWACYGRRNAKRCMRSWHSLRRGKISASTYDHRIHAARAAYERFTEGVAWFRFAGTQLDGDAMTDTEREIGATRIRAEMTAANPKLHPKRL